MDWMKILENYGLFGFLIVSVLVFSGSMLRGVVMHFIAEVKEARQERKEMIHEFSQAHEKVAASQQQFSDAVKGFSNHVMLFSDRNNLEHKDLAQTQGQILDLVRRCPVREYQER